MTRIAFIGLGAMGSRMAARLAHIDGIDVAVYDVDKSKTAELKGQAHVAGSIAEAVDGADGIFSIVPADVHTRAVVKEFLPVAKPGQVFIDFSTIGPSTIEEVERQLKQKGVTTISAGMTKSLGGAETGTLSLYLGGPKEVPSKLRPAFDRLASDLMMVGAVGAAKAMKLVNNMIVATLDVAITEALTLGLQYGLTYQKMADAFASNGANSWTHQNHIIAHVLPNNLGPGFFSTRLLMKDMKLYTEFAKSIRVPAFFAGNALSAYRGAIALGYSEHYHMIIARWYEFAARVGDRPITPPPHGEDEASLLAHLTNGVIAVQALVTADAIRVLGRKGVGAKDAALYLEGGSAGNDSLTGIMKYLETKGPGVKLEKLLADLDKVSAIAEAAHVPNANFELSRQVTLNLLDTYKGVEELWETIPAPVNIQ